MHLYKSLVAEVLNDGSSSEDRTGTGTVSLFSPLDSHYYLKNGFPLLTTKKLHVRGIFEELLWFLSGSSNNNVLKNKGINIWSAWASEDGDLGPIYGHQWRNWNGIDQISNLINEIKTNPNSRRLIVSAWNVSDIDKMALPPCHMFFQVYVRDGKLSLKLYQRSADIFLGVPYNIASYALLTHMIAAQTGYEPHLFIHSYGDAHIYNNHLEQVKLQLTRTPYKLPTLSLNPDVKSIFDYTMDDIQIHNYQAHPHISGEVSV